MNWKKIKLTKATFKYFLLFIFVSCASIKEHQVYVCEGEYAKKYHYSQNCYGLNNCKQKITLVTQEEAEKIGMKICELEVVD